MGRDGRQGQDGLAFRGIGLGRGLPLQAGIGKGRLGVQSCLPLCGRQTPGVPFPAHSFQLGQQLGFPGIHAPGQPGGKGRGQDKDQQQPFQKAAGQQFEKPHHRASSCRAAR